ncbi:MAG: hypothetical protein U0793_10760 [Gemmataceae bacterium]
MNQSLGELPDFYRFVGEKVQKGEAALSPEQVLDEWRSLHPNAAMEEDDVAALQEAIDDIEKGDTGVPFDQFDKDFRRRHGFPPKS